MSASLCGCGLSIQPRSSSLSTSGPIHREAMKLKFITVAAMKLIYIMYRTCHYSLYTIYMYGVKARV